MNLHSMIVDDFLEDFARWREWLDTATFGDVASDVDGVTYPHICMDLPADLRGEIFYKLQVWCGTGIKVNQLFARMSPAGVSPPHFAHHDLAMGNMSCMLYMNRREDCQGGTQLLTHHHYGDNVSRENWLLDTNKPELWDETFMCPMVPNRAFIFPAGKWHGAAPRDGFGTTPADSRLVITAFFNA